MSLVRAALLLAPLAACNPGGTHQGTLVDGIAGTPREGVRVIARSADAADLTCQVREGTTDASGTFTLENTCAGATYTLAAADDTLLLDGPLDIKGGEQPAAPASYTAWRAPTKGAGVYRLEDDALVPLKLFADVHTETVLESDVKVRYPTLKPVKVSSLDEGDWLVLVGKDNVDRLKLHPLVSDGAVRSFEGDVTIDNHVYIGVKFDSDTEYELVDAQLDADKVRNVSVGDHVVRFISKDAVPEGRYALLGDADKKTYVFDFGEVKGEATAKATP
jgi:hypothetical protein